MVKKGQNSREWVILTLYSSLVVITHNTVQSTCGKMVMKSVSAGKRSQGGVMFFTLPKRILRSWGVQMVVDGFIYPNTEVSLQYWAKVYLSSMGYEYL